MTYLSVKFILNQNNLSLCPEEIPVISICDFPHFNVIIFDWNKLFDKLIVMLCLQILKIFNSSLLKLKVKFKYFFKFRKIKFDRVSIYFDNEINQ